MKFRDLMPSQKLLDWRSGTMGPEKQIRWVFDNNLEIFFSFFAIKTYVVGTHNGIRIASQF